MYVKKFFATYWEKAKKKFVKLHKKKLDEIYKDTFGYSYERPWSFNIGEWKKTSNKELMAKDLASKLWDKDLKKIINKRSLTKADKLHIYEKQEGNCNMCDERMRVTTFHVDHKKPVYKGGSDKDSNLQALCPNCHALKTEQDRIKTSKNKK